MTPAETDARSATPSGPLAGITVVDLGQVYLGPYATLLMAKAGADVIKIEPLIGEPLRRRGEVGRGAAVPFVMLNSNKRAVTLNLKASAGRDLLVEMAKRSDVLLENFSPGVMDRLGIGWSVLRAVNPRLVYASGSGFGLSGPDRDNLAMDLTVQAMSGVMSVTGFPDGPPLKAGAAFADFGAGVHLYGAVVTALFDRTRTGRGQLVEVAMEEAVYPALASNLGFLYNTEGRIPPRTGNHHGGLAIAPYNVYPTRDGHVAIFCAVDNHWRNLLDAMGREDLKSEPRFATNATRVRHMAETDRIVQSWTETLTRDEVFAVTKRYRVPSAPVRDLVEVTNDRHMHERGMLEWLDHPDVGRVVVPTSPLRFHESERVATTPSPSLGQHNQDVYGGWLGLTAEEIDALRRDGVI